MHCSFMLAVIAALTVSIAAMPFDIRSEDDKCPDYCTYLNCCPKHVCVAGMPEHNEVCISSLRFGFNPYDSSAW
ncbi:uncharacterized protein EDB91DRAFT_1159769 [Suillus paluster]|uniref:uncharacterized protein n=1 Tax=Suillus paluster TaxID=48578 RepID=UPI001B874A7A|nr:uncharacterized protein EDB91DRAFT_1159769 [Suillus paluster]KAG1729335.1 hypothetical protein EDB91DRAFT_1159769 [Suillus paluster]